jgi:hypothetical protein
MTASEQLQPKPWPAGYGRLTPPGHQPCRSRRGALQAVIRGHTLENRARRSPGAANARAYSVRCYCLQFARFGTPTSANTIRALSVTQALTSGHETLIPVPVPSLGFQFPVQGTYTPLCGTSAPQQPLSQPCWRFCELSSVILPPVHETSSCSGLRSVAELSNNGWP